MENSREIVVFDLEWAGQDVVQIGAVKVTASAWGIVDTFRVFVKPRSPPKSWPAILNFGNEELASANDFPCVILQFLEWCGEDAVFASWGGADLPMVRKNAEQWGCACSLPQSCLDLQKSFGKLVNAKHCVSLVDAAAYCRIPDCYDFHDALNDALYAALIGKEIAVRSKDLLQWKADQRSAKAPSCEPASTNAGPMMNALLQNRCMRRQRCPVCKQYRGFNNWLHLQDNQYIAKATCRQHGAIFACAEISQLPDGQYSAQIAVSVGTPELTERYEQCSAKGMLCSQACLTRQQRKKKQYYIRMGMFG